MQPFLKQFLNRAAAVLLAAFCFALPNAAQAAQSGVFGGGPLYNNAAGNINELKNSGFNEVVVWNIEVRSNGDLNFNGEFPLCSGGVYVGGSTHPDFAGNMASLKQGTVRRITFSVGSSNYGDFENVRDLINSQGTGPGSILYKNFQALKKAIPAVDAIDFDDENCYDQSTMVSFAVMLGGLGYTVALDPYTNMGFWTAVAAQVNTQRPGTIDLVHLQCYSGGAGNDPTQWNFGGIPVQPSVDSNVDSPSQTQAQMAYWRGEAGSTGGWMWLYDQFVGNAAAYASAINIGIGGPTALSAVGGGGSVGLSWTAASGGGTYNLYRGTSAGGENATPIAAGLAGTSYTDGNLLAGTTYFYNVTSVAAGVEAAPANEARATVLAPQILGNSSFENGASNPAPWAATPGVINNSPKEPAHGGSWYAWLDGYGLTHTDTLAQTVTLPATLSTATLNFYLHIDTAERGTAAHDVMKMQIRNSSGAVLATLATYSNLNAAYGYSLKTFNLLPYKGQTIQLYFTGSENSSLPTSFVVDDCAVSAQ